VNEYNLELCSEDHGSVMSKYDESNMKIFIKYGAGQGRLVNDQNKCQKELCVLEAAMKEI
jgi:hypothetical protein